MKYNKVQIAAALAEFIADTDGHNYAAMLTACQAAPPKVDIASAPKSYMVPFFNDDGEPIPGSEHIEYGNKANAAVWNALSTAEQDGRIADRAARDAIFATQGALWMAAQVEEIANPVSTTITAEQLHGAIVPAERDALAADQRENLRDLYALGAGTIDISDGSSARRDLDLMFPTGGAGSTRQAIGQLVRDQTSPRHTVNGRPAPDIGLFERLVKGAS